MIIKVCGMRDSRNIQEVSALAVNWIGLIFYERSPRLNTACHNFQLSTVNYQLKKWAFSSTLPSSP